MRYIWQKEKETIWITDKTELSEQYKAKQHELTNLSQTRRFDRDWSASKSAAIILFIVGLYYKL